MENNKAALHFLFRNRKLLFISLVTGGLLGVGITFFIPKTYLSTAIVYPYSSYAKDNIIGNPQFGLELETEQLMQLMESKSMRDRTIKHFKLYKYYGIDTNDLSWESQLTVRYVKDVSFQRSKYLSVVINVQTTSPKLSAAIANFQVDEVNKYRAAIFEENRVKDLNSSKHQLDVITARLNLLRDSIYAIKTDKSELLYTFMENLDNENYDAGIFVDDPRLESIIQRFVLAYRTHHHLAEEYKTKQLQYETPLPSVYTIDRARPAYKKASPSFVLNGIVSSLALMVVSLTIAGIRRKWLEFKSEMRG
ncbi:MAG TPA: Wzz/FepE/Etk N-terminal domain-containing protein [Fluviicola sp.]|nr:Wzz/FepE/Etk N-terminal domain-containing protein [Fluviicola sp.]